MGSSHLTHCRRAARAAVDEAFAHIPRLTPAVEKSGGEGIPRPCRVLDRPLLGGLLPPLRARHRDRALLAHGDDDQLAALVEQDVDGRVHVVPVHVCHHRHLLLARDEHVHEMEQVEEVCLPLIGYVGLRHERYGGSLALELLHERGQAGLQSCAVKVGGKVHVAGVVVHENVLVQVALAEARHRAAVGHEGAVVRATEADANPLPADRPRGEDHPGLVNSLSHELPVHIVPHERVEHALVEAHALHGYVTFSPARIDQGAELHRRVEGGAPGVRLNGQFNECVGVPPWQGAHLGDHVEVHVPDNVDGL
mmetsp:Transcript_21514/g.63508  ORF Transcript_21514/g.63508 Transcript_21514/m.63508 type:complete len:309 (-) Transcript_21514:138-1064(-)